MNADTAEVIQRGKQETTQIVKIKSIARRGDEVSKTAKKAQKPQDLTQYFLSNWAILNSSYC